MAGVAVSGVAMLQLSNGTWKLSNLALGMATTKRDLEAKCPVPITTSATIATVWATVIGITILNQVRGFELNVRKAQKWLKTCSLPETVALDDLFTAAQQLL